MKLTEYQVKCRTRVSDIRKVKQLNVWGCQLTDVSIISQIPVLELLGLGNNFLTTLKSLKNCHSLKQLYLGTNQIASFEELNYLKEAKSLTKLSLKDNPCSVAAGNGYRTSVLRILPQLETLDDIDITDQERHLAFSERRVHDTDWANYNGHENNLNNLDYQAEQEQDVAHSSQSQKFTPTRSSERGAQRCSRTPSVVSVTSNTDSMVLRLSVQQIPEQKPGSDRITCTCRDKACGNAVSVGREQELKDEISRLYPVDVSRRDVAEQQHRDRNANLLMAALALTKEMDASSLEILGRAIRDQMMKLST